VVVVVASVQANIEAYEFEHRYAGGSCRASGIVSHPQ